MAAGNGFAGIHSAADSFRGSPDYRAFIGGHFVTHPHETAPLGAGVKYEGHIYPGAVHGFNNDATPARYNKAAADAAWKRTIEWFNMYVRG